MFNGKIHYKWPFSIAMLVHQRVRLVIFIDIPYMAEDIPQTTGDIPYIKAGDIPYI